MNILLPLSLLILVLACDVNGSSRTVTTSGQCNDCILLTNCPQAYEDARNHRRSDLLIPAICGYEGRIPKICCSLYQMARIDSHPNQQLLPADCGAKGSGRIVGGIVADLFAYPWMALIGYRRRPDGIRFDCGGSIINSRYVLTAAHCVQNKKIVKVRVGEHNLLSNPDCEYSAGERICGRYQDIEVENYIVHEEFQRFFTVKNDIALLRLKTEINFTQVNVDPICLPKSASLCQLNLDNEYATIAGWGQNENGVQSTVLLKATINVYAADVCRSYYNRKGYEITDGKICAGGVNTDSCNGDSGGPLMIEQMYVDNRPRFIQYGIVSYGPTRCGSDFPGVYTDIRFYMNWILDKIAP